MGFRDALTVVAALVLVAHMTVFVPGDIITPAAAFIVVLLWLAWHPTYEYVGGNRYIMGRINLFALFAWTSGLVVVFDIHIFVLGGNFWLTLPLWLLVILSAEWFGYHALDVRIDRSDSGLFGLDFMHGSRMLKVFYLLGAPFFALAMERAYAFL